VASEYAPLLGDLARLLDIPVAAYRTFIDDFVERVAEMPEMLSYAHDTTVELDPVVLHLEVDNDLTSRISQQLREIAAR